ncbi:MAG: class I SAM-dependent methyltransferase [Pseudomonadota bacterium]
MTQTPAEDHWSAAQYETAARFVSDLGAPVLDLLDPRPGERILDLGCGDGALTARIANAGASVLGVDASPDMVAAARARGLAAEPANGTALRFDAAFDAVFSNAALHWMTAPEAVLEGVARALRPGGRFVAEMGGHANVAAIRTALIAVLAQHGVETDLNDVWYFPTAEEQRARLKKAGFAVKDVALIHRPTPIPTDLDEWLRVLAAPALAKLPHSMRSVAAAQAAALAAPALRNEAGLWIADYVRLRFRAVLA